jgi:hypothetical protein
MGLRAAQIRAQLTELVDGMDLDVVSGADADAAVLVREYSLIEKVAASARTLAAARVAETSAWVGEGDRSAEDWLSRQTGTSVGAAARDLRTGKRVKGQPKTKAAMKQGTLSPEQAGAVAEAVEVDPGAETALIEAAKRETFKNLQDQARRIKAAATDDADRARRHHRERSARTGTDADGAFCLSLRGPATDGARILALLKPLQEQAFRAARSTAASAVNRDTFDNRTYDAVLAMLLGNTASRSGTTSTSEPPPSPTEPVSDPTDQAVGRADTPPPVASEPSLFDVSAPPDPTDQRTNPARQVPGPGPAEDQATHGIPDAPNPGLPHHNPPVQNPPCSVPSEHAPSPPARLPGGNNTTVIVRVDLEALLRGRTVAGETSEIAGLGPIPISVVREMLDDAFLAVVVTKGRDVVSVAHHGRGLNVHQRTAIEAQGLRCSNLACNQSVGIQVDHRHPWAKDRVTKLDNQDPLCGPCHRRKTHDGWHLEAGTGPRRFLPPARAG